MDSRIWSIPLEEKDIKRLKRKRLFQLILMIYLILVDIGATIGFIWIQWIENDEVAGALMGVLAAGIALVVFIVRRSWSNLDRDLKGGIKQAVSGKVEGMYSYKNRFELKVNGQDYRVGSLDYHNHSIGDEVLITFGPASKVMLDIRLLNPNDDSTQ